MLDIYDCTAAKMQMQNGLIWERKGMERGEAHDQVPIRPATRKDKNLITQGKSGARSQKMTGSKQKAAMLG
jgi:hypothetical protein